MLITFVFIDIWFVKQDIQKWLKTKICSFLWRIWKWKEKGAKKFDLPWRGFEPRIFNKFPPKIWNLREIRFIKPGVLRTSGLYYCNPEFCSAQWLQLIFAKMPRMMVCKKELSTKCKMEITRCVKKFQVYFPTRLSFSSYSWKEVFFTLFLICCTKNHVWFEVHT